MQTDNRNCAPNGFVIDLYKYLNTPHSDFRRMEQFYIDHKNSFESRFGKREIVYGNYDRIQIRPVCCFNDYSRLSDQGYDWFGNSQSIFVFPLEDDEKKRAFWCTNLEGTLFVKRGEQKERLKDFLATSFCYICDEARGSAVNYKKLLEYCKIQINAVIDLYNKYLEKEQNGDYEYIHSPITAEVFGSFSSAEVVILWSAKQYTDILYLADCMREITWKNGTLFRTTYTMISYPDALPNVEVQTCDESEILGDAYVQLALQEGIGADQIQCDEGGELDEGYSVKQFVEKALNNAREEIGDSEEVAYEILDCAGEYDLVFKTKSKYLTRIFRNPENTEKRDNQNYICLSIHCRAFNKRILHTTSRLCYVLEDLPAFVRGLDWKRDRKNACKTKNDFEEGHTPQEWRADIIQQVWNIKNNEFRKLKQRIEKKFPAISGFAGSIDQLFSDYVQCCSTSADYLWIQDYHTVFQKVINMLEYYVGECVAYSESIAGYFDDDVEMLEEMDSLVAAIQQQTSHIMASSKLFFNEQNFRFGYTAQYDLVIHAYYGIIKQLIENIYNNAETNAQSEIYPLVNFRSLYSVESQMFVDEPAPMRYCNERLVVFKMPLDSMSNIMHYLPMMIHEVYHYAAPLRRGDRNRLLAKIGTFWLIRQSCLALFREAVDKVWPKLNIRHKDKVQVGVEQTLLQTIDANLYNTIEEMQKGIYSGIKHFYEADENMVLRSWFKECLRMWMFSGETLSNSNLGDIRVFAFADVIEQAIDRIKQDLLAQAKELEETQRVDPRDELYYRALKCFLECEDNANETSGESSIYQRLIETADVLYNSEVETIFDQLDEVLPDCAMICLVDMSISEYLLQIALNLDVQLFSPQSMKRSDNLRFGALIHWMLEKKTEGVIEEQFEEELRKFATLYRASYEVARAKADDQTVQRKIQRWTGYFREMHETYEDENSVLGFVVIQPWISQLIKKHMVPILNESFVLGNLFKETYHEYLSVLRLPAAVRQDKLFKMNINTILKFQGRKSLKEINIAHANQNGIMVRRGSSTSGVKTNRKNTKEYVYQVNSFEMLHFSVAAALSKLYIYRKNENCPSTTGMWYRGCGNAEFEILPSGLVHFAEDAARITGNCEIGKVSYLQSQRHSYEVFRYASDGASEQINAAIYTTPDYLALMQHYAQHANLLDWSEDAYTAMYFALEDEIKAKGTYEYENHDAAVYILDPIRFNIAISSLEKMMGLNDNNKGTRELIPNISIRDNQVVFGEYCDVYGVEDQSWYEVKETDPEQRKNKVSFERLLIELRKRGANDATQFKQRLPIAVYTSKLNPRMRAQSGLFVAYSMLSKPAVWDNQSIDTKKPSPGLFYYQSLEELQEYYCQQKEGNPFLMKIIIPKEIKKEVGETLRHYGMSEEKIYPELEKLRTR